MSPPAPGPGEPDPPGAGSDGAGPDPAGSRPDDAGPGGGSGRRWVPFGYLFALYFILGGSETMISPLFPLVRVDLGLDESHQAAILAAVAAGIASFNLIGGAASRRLTDRALVRSAAACLAAGMVLSGAAPSFWPLLAGQALLGVAFGIFFPPALAVVARLYPSAVGKAIAAYGLAYSFGLAAAALTGNVGAGNWRWVFYACALPALAAVLWTPGWPEPDRDPALPPLWAQIRQYARMRVLRLSGLASFGGVSMHYVVIGFAPVYFVDRGIHLGLTVSLIAAGRVLSAGVKLVGGALYDRYGGLWTARLMMLVTSGLGVPMLAAPTNWGVWLLVPFVGIAVSVLPVANAMLVGALPPQSGWGIGVFRAALLGSAALLSAVVSLLLRWLPLETLMLASLSLPLLVAAAAHAALNRPNPSAAP